MTTEEVQETTFDEMLEMDCMHCAVTHFIFKWRAHKPDDEDRGELPMVVAKLIESATDAIASIPDEDERNLVCKLALRKLSDSTAEIIDNTYGDNVPTIKESDIEPTRN